jgi:hypothetical protein
MLLIVFTACNFLKNCGCLFCCNMAFCCLQSFTADKASFIIKASQPDLKKVVSEATHVTLKVLESKQLEALSSPGSTVNDWPVGGVLLLVGSRAEMKTADVYLAEFMAPMN